MLKNLLPSPGAIFKTAVVIVIISAIGEVTGLWPFVFQPISSFNNWRRGATGG